MNLFKALRIWRAWSRLATTYRKAVKSVNVGDKPAVQSKAWWGAVLVAMPAIIESAAGFLVAVGVPEAAVDAVKKAGPLIQALGAALGLYGIRQAVGRANGANGSNKKENEK